MHLSADLTGDKLTPTDEVPFSSALKWSALAFDDETMRGTYVLGALAMLRGHLEIDDTARRQIESWAAEGLRVLVFAHNPDVKTLYDAGGKPTLSTLTLLGIVSLSDELRPHLKETIEEFSTNGIALKVISGDDPQTVAALAKQAGLANELTYISGPELNEMDDAQFAQVVSDATVFGRITPEQKERLVDALRQQGQYVAMIGDGSQRCAVLKEGQSRYRDGKRQRGNSGRGRYDSDQ